ICHRDKDHEVWFADAEQSRSRLRQVFLAPGGSYGVVLGNAQTLYRVDGPVITAMRELDHPALPLVDVQFDEGEPRVVYVAGYPLAEGGLHWNLMASVASSEDSTLASFESAQTARLVASRNATRVSIEESIALDQRWLERTGSKPRAETLASPETISIYSVGAVDVESIVAGTHGRWCDAGERLAYTTVDGHPAVWIASREGIVLAQYEVHTGAVCLPVWSPDGRYVVWCLADRESSILVDTDTHAVERLPFGYSTAVFCPLSTGD